jgi:hypothetical protein
VESRTTGLRKPDPRIYLHACESLRVTPAEAVFLDDIGGNLKARSRARRSTSSRAGSAGPTAPCPAELRRSCRLPGPSRKSGLSKRGRPADEEGWTVGRPDRWTPALAACCSWTAGATRSSISPPAPGASASACCAPRPPRRRARRSATAATPSAPS